MQHCSLFRTPEDTLASARRLARALVQEAREGLLLSLVGPLGVGKTVFVKGLAEGLGIDPEQVSSPTFVIANRYDGGAGATLHHVDFYRLESLSELESIGFFDLLEPGAVVAVEWADRFAEALPADRLELHMTREAIEEDAAPSAAEDSGLRRLAVAASGPRAARVLALWQPSNRAGDES